jgi:hypothetical protein
MGSELFKLAEANDLYPADLGVGDFSVRYKT